MFSVNQRVKRTTHNIEECLRVPSSFRRRYELDTERKWASGRIVGFENFGPGMFGNDLIVAKVAWDNGEILPCVLHYLEVL